MGTSEAISASQGVAFPHNNIRLRNVRHVLARTWRLARFTHLRALEREAYHDSLYNMAKLVRAIFHYCLASSFQLTSSHLFCQKMAQNTLFLTLLLLHLFSPASLAHPLLSPLTLPSNTPSRPSPPPPHPIHCHDPAGPPRRARTNVSTCRLTLNEIRKFPSYRLIQPFLEDKLPKSPSTPPFAVHHVNSDCVIRIASADAEIEDRFSWEMVRSVATGIVEDCEWGGVAGIGKGGRGRWRCWGRGRWGWLGRMGRRLEGRWGSCLRL